MKSGLVYFLIVFGAGFVLGTIRVLLLVPRFGEQTAEFIELPVMLVIIFFSAQYLVTRFRIRAAGDALIVGAVALFLLILAELTLVLILRGLTISEYLQSRNTYSFVAYLISLVVYSLMPLALMSSNAEELEGRKRDQTG